MKNIRQRWGTPHSGNESIPIFRHCTMLLLGLLLSAVADADTIVSTFGTGGSYEINGGLSISTLSSANHYEQEEAVGFTPSQNYTLSQIDVALGYFMGTNSFVVNLSQDNGGPTGTLLQSWTFAALSFLGPDVDTLVPASPIVLDEGVTYWIAALPGANDTWGAWNFVPSPPSTMVGLQATSQDGGNTWYPPVVAPILSAYDVLGTPVAAPEPSSAALLACAGIGLALWSRRRGSSQRPR